MGRKPKVKEPTETRKSTRIRAKQDTKLGKTVLDSGVTSSSRLRGIKRKAGEPNDDSRRKRVAKRKGKLSKIVDMPLDILHEIFSYLEPYDLLRLARMTKATRSILMSSYSKDIWKCSLAAVEDLPACPDGMVEPQYANLMFSYHCHECGLEPDRDGPVLFTFMEARTQLCAPCSRVRFKTWQTLPHKIPKHLSEFVPATSASFGTGNKPGYSEGGAIKFHVETALAIHKEYAGLEDDGSAKELWTEGQKERWKRIRDHAELCNHYLALQLQQEEELMQMETADRELVKMIRQSEIHRRLCDLGWREEIDYLNRMHDEALLRIARAKYRNPVTRLQDHKLVDQYRKLTDKEWERIQPKLADWISPTRVKVIRKRKEATVQDRIKQWIEPMYVSFMLGLPGDMPRPSLLEVCLMEEFRTPLEDRLDEMLSEETFAAASAALPLLIEKWRTDKEDELLALVCRSDAYKEVDPDTITRDTLQFATTVFFCLGCLKGMHYHRVFVHHCFRRTHERKLRMSGSRQKNSASTEYQPGSLISLGLKGRYCLSFHDSSRLVFFDAAFYHLRALLDLNALPHTTTVQELKELDLYAQGKCPCFKGNPDIDLEYLHWTQILTQFCHIHKKNRGYSDSFALLEEEDIQELSRQRQANSASRTPMYGCVVCVDTAWAKHLVIPHFADEHNVDRAAAEKYIEEVVLDQDAPSTGKKPTWLR